MFQMEVDQTSAQAALEVDLSPGGVGIPAEVLQRLPLPPVADPADNVDVRVGSATWHSQVPAVSSSFSDRELANVM